MIIKKKGTAVREARLSSGINETKDAWKIKTFCDAAEYGAEIIWPYESLEFKPISTEFDFNEEIKLHYNHFKRNRCFVEVDFSDTLVKIQTNYSLLIIPHHSSYLDDSLPLAVSQMIEYDWWTGHLSMLFVNKNCRFVKGYPCAQSLIVPRNEYLVRDMSESELKHMENANAIIQSDSRIITRSDKDGNFTHDNVYERLSSMNKSGMLPHGLLEDRQPPSPRIKWR